MDVIHRYYRTSWSRQAGAIAGCLGWDRVDPGLEAGTTTPPFCGQQYPAHGFEIGEFEGGSLVRRFVESLKYMMKSNDYPLKENCPRMGFFEF